MTPEPKTISSFVNPGTSVQPGISSPGFEAQDFLINIGPQHPSTHGVLHLKVHLSGEVITDLEPCLGYVHRGVEKMCEKLSYRQFIYLSSRLDYLSAHINNQACVIAIETALGTEATPRAQAIRIIMSELTRLASHQLWWGCMGMDLGAFTPFFYGFRDRELITDIFEETCGTRLTMNYMVPGGVMHDIHINFVRKVEEYLVHLTEKLPEYDEILSGNQIFLERVKGIGMLSREDAISYGCSGPVARASGLSCDIRKSHPYDGYDKITFKEILSSGCDNFARYQVRLGEMRESIAIIEQLIGNIPEGDFQAKVKKVIKLPKGEFYQRVETARGEFGVYIVSDGGNTPFRLKFRSPGFSNLSVLKKLCMGLKIADLVATMATLDLVIPDIDR